MVKFLFGIHCHQPVDNFHHIVYEAIEKSYKPFLKVSKNYEFKFAVHYSGWLLEFIKNNDKELFSLMKKLSDRGLIEFFSGGYYEPVLASIPSDDRKIQIEKLNNFIKNNFGQEPKGLWLTERVWENSIVKDLAEIGIEYVMVDDYHFISNGYKKEQLYGYYLTEEEGHKIKIFPIDKTLRYITPFKPVNEVIQYLHSIKGKAGIIFDDGEKFGIWPHTYDWVYKNGWLEQFIEAVISDSEIQNVHYKEFAENEKPEGLCYLPTTSYYEMGEWSLFTEAQVEMTEFQKLLEQKGFKNLAEKYVKGGIWKNFFSKYPESNRIHKRYLNLSIKNRDLKNREIFLENLLKAQCNDVLWHGIFGGLYLPNLRDNAYRYIIQAEKELENIKGKQNPTVEDLYYYGYDTVKYTTDNLILIYSTKEGGQLTELSIKDKAFNFQNSLTRRKEGYHEEILKPSKSESSSEEGITTIHNKDLEFEDREKLIFDWYEKNSFVDHIVEDINHKEFYRCEFRELGDFTNMPFEIKDVSENLLSLYREGGIYKDNSFYRTVLQKDFHINENSIEFLINIKTEYENELKYILEFNFHFANIEDVQINGKNLREINELQDKIFNIYDKYTEKNITIQFEKDTKLLTYTVETVNQSEKGLDTIVQGQTFGFIFVLNREAEIKGKVSITSRKF